MFSCDTSFWVKLRNLGTILVLICLYKRRRKRLLLFCFFLWWYHFLMSSCPLLFFNFIWFSGRFARLLTKSSLIVSIYFSLFFFYTSDVSVTYICKVLFIFLLLDWNFPFLLFHYIYKHKWREREGKKRKTDRRKICMDNSENKNQIYLVKFAIYLSIYLSIYLLHVLHISVYLFLSLRSNQSQPVHIYLSIYLSIYQSFSFSFPFLFFLKPSNYILYFLSFLFRTLSLSIKRFHFYFPVFRAIFFWACVLMDCFRQQYVKI